MPDMTNLQLASYKVVKRWKRFLWGQEQGKDSNLITFIQHNFESPSYSNHRSKRSAVEEKKWNCHCWTSLVGQWLRICLPMQESWVWSLVLEDPTCHGAAKPMCHNDWAWVPQLLEPTCLKPTRHALQQEKPLQREACHHGGVAPSLCSCRKPAHSNEDPVQPKLK